MAWLDGYQPVEDRLREFHEKHPMGRVNTELLSFTPEGDYIFKTELWLGDELREGRPAATGHAHDSVAALPAHMKNSALETCETSSVGRALANLGFAPKGARPSREEMESKAVPDAGKGGSVTPEGTPPPASDPVGGGAVTGEGAITPPPAHEHQWIQSPRVSKWDVCTFPDCTKTRKHEPTTAAV